MGKLSDIVSLHDAIHDLPTLAFRSGIDHNLLLLVDQGALQLATQHIDALVAVLGREFTSVLGGDGSAVSVTTIISRKGVVPDGYQFMLISGGALTIGDLISYVPESSSIGSRWVAVDAISRYKSRNQFFSDILSNGDTVASITSNQIIRIARRAAN